MDGGIENKHSPYFYSRLYRDRHSRYVSVSLRVTMVIVVAALTMTALASTAMALAPQRGEAQESKPNIVIVLLDDLDDRISPKWDALALTKQKIKDQGLTFENAFASLPICCPSRAGILTGKNSHNTGVFNNAEPHGGWQNFITEGNVPGGNNEEHSVPVWLDGAGYTTGYFGKYLNGIENEPAHVPPGWDTWVAPVDIERNYYGGYNYTLNEGGRLVDYGEEPSDYITDVLKRKAVNFLRLHKMEEANSPFLLWVSPTAPHQAIDAAPRHQPHPWQNAPVPKNPNYKETFFTDKPDWLRNSVVARRSEIDSEVDLDYQRRMGSLLAVDEMVNAIVRELETQHSLHNTYIIFASDNGYQLGALNLSGKGYPYEESSEVPLVISGPGVPRGATEYRQALLLDLAPTVAEIAGVEVPSDVDGMSLAPLLRGDTPPSWRDDFLLEYNSGWQDVPEKEQHCNALTWRSPTHRSVRTERYAYYRWHDPHEFGDCMFGQPTGYEYELYDLDADPWQQKNLLSDRQGREQYRELWDELEARVLELEQCSGSSCW